MQQIKDQLANMPTIPLSELSNPEISEFMGTLGKQFNVQKTEGSEKTRRKKRNAAKKARRLQRA